MSMAHTTVAPALARTTIMQLLERYRGDPRPDKLNLAVGIYTDESGHCPILDSVRAAELHRVAHQTSKASFNLAGAPDFHRAVRKLLLPDLSEADGAQVAVVQTLGASGALHLAAQLLARRAPGSRIWLSAPTWENHTALLAPHGRFGHYRYRAATRERFCLDSALSDLERAAPGDIVLLHVCCHNPTGIDPDPEQWAALARFCAERRLLPLFDFAYQGLARSLEQDCAPLALFREQVECMMVCSSFSKNMGIYDERTGALTLVSRDPARLARWSDDLRQMIRASYSMPPLHGSYIVSHLVNDPERHRAWRQEVELMRDDLNRRRQALLEALGAAGLRDAVLSYQRQQGMFLCLDLAPAALEQLRAEHGIYLLDSGRLSVASLARADMPRLCHALSDVLARDTRRSA